MKALFTLLFSFGAATALAQAPGIQWQKTLGGSLAELGYSVRQTGDGGYILAGTSESIDGDVTGNHGDADFWIVKLDNNGTVQWKNSYGGTDYDGLAMLQPTADGGYVALGTTASDNGDVSGKRGDSDYWVLKITGTGAVQWQRCLGGRYDDIASSIRQTADHGYIISGQTSSANGDVSGFHGGNFDSWVVKLDSAGTMEWGKCLGGGNADGGRDAQQTADGGYIVASYTTSADGDVSGNHGSYDGWLVKLDNTGTAGQAPAIEWQKCLGGSSAEDLYSIAQTTDGGYIVAGKTASSDGDVTMNHGGDDYWILKLDGMGAIQWQRSFGGTSSEAPRAIRQTTDGGYIVAGYSSSLDGDVTGHHGTTSKNDFWIVKLSGGGLMQWQKSLGGSNEDAVFSVDQTSDGGYVLGGYTYSTDGDLSGSRVNADYWIVKLTAGPAAVSDVSPDAAFSLYPNPAQNEIFLQSNEGIRSVLMTDLSGKKVAQFSGNNVSEMALPTTGLANGTYFVRVETASGATTQKVLIAPK